MVIVKCNGGDRLPIRDMNSVAKLCGKSVSVWIYVVILLTIMI